MCYPLQNPKTPKPQNPKGSYRECNAETLILILKRNKLGWVKCATTPLKERKKPRWGSMSTKLSHLASIKQRGNCKHSHKPRVLSTRPCKQTLTTLSMSLSINTGSRWGSIMQRTWAKGARLIWALPPPSSTLPPLTTLNSNMAQLCDLRSIESVHLPQWAANLPQITGKGHIVATMMALSAAVVHTCSEVRRPRARALFAEHSTTAM